MPIPGMRGSDHIGFTVPDLDEAEAFLVDVLGATPVYRVGGKREDEGDWMTRQLGVSPRTAIEEIRFYRLGNGTNLEVFAFNSPEGQAPQPKNSDIGGHHIALYVDDLDAAITYLRAHDIDVMGEAMSSSGPGLGQRWIYFRSPWGMQFELISFPQGKGYEATVPVRLWHPACPAE
jgi:catechol 2,3-dioxygenase-like lactoylglutathione lyase family enzyme